MAEAIAAFVIIGSIVFLAGRSLFANKPSRHHSSGCGMKACSSSGCCNQMMEKMNEE